LFQLLLGWCRFYGRFAGFGRRYLSAAIGFDVNKSRTFAKNFANNLSFSYTSAMQGFEEIVGDTICNGDQQTAGSLGVIAYINHLLRE